MKQLFFSAFLFITLSLLQQAAAQTNTRYGTNALNPATTGNFNSAFGYNALRYNTSGFQNTATGSLTLRNNTSGSNNSASGHLALGANTTGSNNTATGAFSLYSNTSGFTNTAFGNSALNKNTTGNANTATGNEALFSNTTGSGNTVSGNQALRSNTTGFDNTATGFRALYANTTGTQNTAYGSHVLRFNTTGTKNTASGLMALYNNTTGSENTATGYKALTSNTSGYFNTASGNGALLVNTTGHENTAFGSNALYQNTTGSYNTAVGWSAGTGIGSFNNTTALGFGATTTASNQVRIGNTAVTSIGGQVGWTTLSDGRFKRNIQEDVPGLSFIIKLRAVIYTLDIDALDNASSITELPSAQQAVAKVESAKEKHTGFIAQEVEETAKKLNYEFSGIDKPENDRDLYGLRYAEFVVPLVKGMQEQQQQIEELQQQVAELKAMVTRLANGPRVNTNNFISAYLEQNTPNPVNGNTTIRYHVPENITAAQLHITNVQGQVLKTITISYRGAGEINLNTQTLASGTYNYTLYVDGEQADTKRLIIVK
jgi:trimeric autotransporter adhesin